MKAQSGTTRTPRTVDRKVIISSAARLFRQQGFHATTMQEIGDSVGILKGSLYHHIASKEDLLEEILLASVTEVLAAVEEAAAAAPTPRERLHAVIKAELVAMAARQDEIIVWLTERRRVDVPLDRIEALAKKVDRTLNSILRDGARGGDWSGNDLDTAYQAIRGMIAWFPMWYRPNGSRSVSSIADAFAGYAEALLDRA